MAKKPPLTEQKLKWAQNRNTVLRGTHLAYNASQQKKYQSVLQRPIRLMSSEVKEALTTLFNSRPAKKNIKVQKEASVMDESITTKAKVLMNALTAKFQKMFNDLATPTATAMIEGAKKSSESALNRSLKQLSGGLSLKTGVVPEGMEDISRSLIQSNVSLIKTIPKDYFNDVTGAVFRSITTGEGIAELLPQISKYDGISLRKAKMISHDQTRKAYNFINKSRMQSVGTKQFEWVHSGGGQKPRPSHLKISGHIFSFENLKTEQAALGVPEADRGIPGEPINCGCTMLPVITFGDEDDES
jgi:SPP1 gp7 family putative phage head morphogenesis protein